MPVHSTTIFTLAYLLPLSLAHLPQQKKHYLNMLSSKTNALLTHTLASFWRKQSCPGLICVIKYKRAQSLADELAFIPHLNHAETHDDVIEWKHFSVTGPLWGNPPVSGGFPSQRPVTRSFDVFFDLRMNKRLSSQSRCQWFETPSRSLWRHCNGLMLCVFYHRPLFHKSVPVWLPRRPLYPQWVAVWWRAPLLQWPGWTGLRR